MILTAFTMVKVDGDIIEEFVRHTLRFVDRMIVLDNASPDSTRETLQALEREGLPITVWHDEFIAEDPDLFGQAARKIFATSDTEFLLLLDADEFVKAPSRDELETALKALRAGAHALVPWETYVPTAQDDAEEPRLLSRLRHRLRSESRPYSKVFVNRSFQELVAPTIILGNHAVVDPSGTSVAVLLESVTLAHFPVRSQAQLQRKVLLGWTTYLAMGHSEVAHGVGYQWHRLYQKLRANSTWTEHDFLHYGLHYLDDDEADPDIVLDPLPPVERRYIQSEGNLLEIAIEFMRQLAFGYAKLSAENSGLRTHLVALAESRDGGG